MYDEPRPLIAWQMHAIWHAAYSLQKLYLRTKQFSIAPIYCKSHYKQMQLIETKFVANS